MMLPLLSRRSVPPQRLVSWNLSKGSCNFASTTSKLGVLTCDASHTKLKSTDAMNMNETKGTTSLITWRIWRPNKLAKCFWRSRCLVRAVISIRFSGSSPFVAEVDDVCLVRQYCKLNYLIVKSPPKYAQWMRFQGCHNQGPPCAEKWPTCLLDTCQVFSQQRHACQHMACACVEFFTPVTCNCRMPEWLHWARWGTFRTQK